MENEVVVNGKPCKIIYINDEDGFHSFHAIPEDDPIISKIDEAYDGRSGAAFLSDELIDEIEMYPKIDCDCICRED